MKSKPIHLVLLPLALGLLLADCAAQQASETETPGRFDENRPIPGHEVCPGTNKSIKGSSFVQVKYGDSKLDVTPHTRVRGSKQDTGSPHDPEATLGAIEFKLIPVDKPNEPDSKALVTIVGTEGPTPDADLSWLSAQGRGRASIVVCPYWDTPSGTYKYEVSVAGVGTLDPRADVFP